MHDAGHTLDGVLLDLGDVEGLLGEALGDRLVGGLGAVGPELAVGAAARGAGIILAAVVAGHAVEVEHLVEGAAGDVLCRVLWEMHLWTRAN